MTLPHAPKLAVATSRHDPLCKVTAQLQRGQGKKHNPSAAGSQAHFRPNRRHIEKRNSPKHKPEPGSLPSQAE
ncbi:hypothetical protein AHIS1636_27350 [Arthrobacter mangrovi]|uniref:Uncharacterized protein n=1 Tax=Arthrobacter mangrovi TaxID=2966350 RepID=A0ABQ5MWI1_9MICC|nr:hypothetical protein AHIS1636_27350 [Arthrobacter mangrovi]